MLTAKQAAEETGRSKEAILKAIKSGRLSANKDGKGQWAIDPAELFRVYPTTENGSGQNGTVGSELYTRYKAETDLMRQQIAQMESTISDLRKRLDVESEERRSTQEKLTALLTDQRGHNGGLWSRLFGK